MCGDFLASFGGPIGTLAQGQQTANSLYDASAAVANSNIDNMKQIAYSQNRRLGDQKASIGKAGLKLSGSAATLIDEQMKQDELTLLKEKYNAVMTVKEYFGKAKTVQQSAFQSASTDVAKAIIGGM